MRDVNPFSTRFTRPGAMEYILPPGERFEALVARLQANHWRGQIIGPHGSGKSTLLTSLLAPLAAAGMPAWQITLRDGECKLPGDWQTQVAQAGARLVIVDGCEQLSRLERWRLRWQCRRRGWGLLITAHRNLGLPTLWRTQPSLELAWELVEHLLPADAPRIDRERIAQAYQTAGGDLRETLFALYDEYERQLAERG